MAEVTNKRRHLSPADIAADLGVAIEKVVAWIKAGELKAIDVANRGSRLPRFKISPEAYQNFQRLREVIPAGESQPTPRMRRKAAPGARNYF